jgi:hypothetical protein
MTLMKALTPERRKIKKLMTGYYSDRAGSILLLLA